VLSRTSNLKSITLLSQLSLSTCSLMTTCDMRAVSVKPLISWKPNCGCWWCAAGWAIATAGTGIDVAGIPAPTATAGVGIGMCSGSSGCGVEPSLAVRLGADSWGSSLSSSDVSLRYEPGVRSYTYNSYCTTTAEKQKSINQICVLTWLAWNLTEFNYLSCSDAVCFISERTLGLKNPHFSISKGFHKDIT